MTKKNTIMLVCSSGGHFLQMYSLENFWGTAERCWVTFKKEDTSCLLAKEKVYWAFSPTNRNLKNLIKNIFLAVRVLIQERPRLIVSTGAGVAVPFMYVGRLLGIKTIYIESLARIEDLSLTGKLVYPVVNHMLVQWPQIVPKYKKVQYQGCVL